MVTFEPGANEGANMAALGPRLHGLSKLSALQFNLLKFLPWSVFPAAVAHSGSVWSRISNEQQRLALQLGRFYSNDSSQNWNKELTRDRR